MTDHTKEKKDIKEDKESLNEQEKKENIKYISSFWSSYYFKK